MAYEYVNIGDTTKRIFADIVDTDKYVPASKLIDPTDGSSDPWVVDMTGQPALPTVQIGANGEPLVYAEPLVISAVPALSTSPAYAINDAMGTVLTFANAARTGVNTGSIRRVTFYDFDNLNHAADYSVGAYLIDFFSATVTGVTDNAAYAITNDTQVGTYIGSIWTDQGRWRTFGPGMACTVTPHPLDYKVAATSLFGVLVAVTADSGVSSASGKRVDIQVVVD